MSDLKLTKKEQAKKEKIALLIEFYNLNKRPPKQKEIYKGVKIGIFLINIRQGNTKISRKDKLLLEQSGIDLTSTRDDIKNRIIHNKVLLLIEFYNLYNRLPSYKELYKDIDLHYFVNSLKKGTTKLSDEDLNLLLNAKIKERNFTSERLHNKILLLIEFYNLFGRLPKQRESYKDVKIGSFLDSIKQRQTNISEEDMKLLLDSGIVITINNKKEQVHQKLLLLVEFFELYGRTPHQKEVYKDIKLGNFFYRIKYGQTTLSKEDANLIINMGIKIEKVDINEQKHNKVLLLIEFYNLYGRCPKLKESYKGANIGYFFNSIVYKKTSLSPEDLKLLKNSKIKITPNKIYDSIHHKVLLIIEFYNLYGREPKLRETYKDVNIGTFLYNLKHGAKNLSVKDSELLIKNGIKLKHISIKDKIHYKVLILIEFYKLYGRAPMQREVYKDINIGTFLCSIKSNQTTISNEDRRLIEDTGISLTKQNKNVVSL